ncbi:MAG: 30S ribosomal protein S4 [bacterium]
MKTNKCKICRQLGIKLFLKGERCFSPKCAMIKKAYPPGPKKKRRGRGLSEYGRQLKEKQKLRHWYGLEERQFARYIKAALATRKKEEDAATVLIKVLESRLDNTVFRMGLASSRVQARQLVTHGHFSINGRKVDIPSYLVKKGDIIKFSPQTLQKESSAALLARIKKAQPPVWLVLDVEKAEAKVVGQSTFELAAPPVDMALIFGFYSK